MAAFSVQHIDDYDVPSTGGNQTITSVDTTRAFVFNTNTRMLSGGPNGDTSNLEVDEASLGVNLSTATNVNFARQANALLSTRSSASVWEYTGTAGGPNEFLIRGTGTVSMLNTDRTKTATCSTTPTDIDKCVVFVHGISSDRPSQDLYHNLTVVGWLSGTNTINFERGGGTSTTDIYYTVVEFTGSNWTVHHGFSGDVAADTGTITLYDGQKGTGLTSSVTAWNKAFIYGLFKGDDSAVGNDNASDLWPTYDPNVSTGIVDWTFDAAHVGVDNQHLVYVIENSDANFSVARYQSTTTAPTTITITAVTALTEALVVGTSRCNNAGAGQIRGGVNYGFNSTTQVYAYAHRSSASPDHEVQVIDLSGMASGAPGGVTVNATAESFTLTDNNVYVQAHQKFDLTKGTFTLTEYNPTVDAGSIISAGIENFTFTSFNVDVDAFLAVEANFESFTLTPYSVDVKAEFDTVATINNFTLTEYNPDIAADFTLDVSFQQLTFTPYNPVVTIFDPNIEVTPNLFVMGLQARNVEVTGTGNALIPQATNATDSGREIEQAYYAQWEAIRMAIYEYYQIDDNNIN